MSPLYFLEASLLESRSSSYYEGDFKWSCRSSKGFRSGVCLQIALWIISAAEVVEAGDEQQQQDRWTRGAKDEEAATPH